MQQETQTQNKCLQTDTATTHYRHYILHDVVNNYPMTGNDKALEKKCCIQSRDKQRNTQHAVEYT